MMGTHNTIPIHFSPFEQGRLWFLLAVVVLGLAAGAYYWHEGAQYHLYLIAGCVFVVLGILPLLFRLFHGKAK